MVLNRPHRLWSAALLSIPGKGIRSATSACVPAPAVFYDPRTPAQRNPCVKGKFKLGNGRYCNPLTITDNASGFLLLCEALVSTREDLACTAFEVLIQSPA